jgi:hypothetical protein
MTNDEGMTTVRMTKVSSLGLRTSFVILVSSFVVSPCRPALGQDERGLGLSVAWPTERVELTDGRVLRGLIEDQSQGHLNFLEVRRNPGRPPSLIGHFLAKKDVAKVDRLPEEARAELARRLDSVKSRAAIEAGRVQNVQLEPIDRDGERIWSYTGPWFRIEAALAPWEVRTVVVRLEQMFRGFEQVLGATARGPAGPRREISILVFGDHRRYAAFLRRQGLPIKNPAFFDPALMQVVVSSDLARLHQSKDAIDEDHARRRRELFPDDRAILAKALENLDAELTESGLNEAERERIKSLALARRRLEQASFDREVQLADRKNRDEIYKERQALQQRLFHEAFHAFAEQQLRLHPDARPGPSDNAAPLPLWLAEGLAQIFESAVFETDDLLRIDAPDAERLARLQEDLASSAAPLRLSELLVADQGNFLVPHDASGQTSARHYLYAWGVAYYLAFEQAGLSATELREYAADRADPLAAFERLAGAPLPDFEAQWRQAIRERM